MTIAFYPGSFDPITRGHLDIISRGLVFCSKIVIGVGRNVHKKTLFTAEERVDLVNATLRDHFSATDLARLTVTPFNGATVDYAQQVNASLILKGLRGAVDYSYEEKMVIVNQRLAPKLESVFLFTDNALRDVSSTVVKEMAYAGIVSDKFDHYLTETVRDALLARINPKAD